MENEPIGGYFSLETDFSQTFPHIEGILLNSGRNAIKYVLKVLGDVKKVYLPFFTCQVALDPIIELGISYFQYHINSDLKILDDIDLREGEYIIYPNYFGLMDGYCKILALKYGSRLIVDNAQSFFSDPIKGGSTVYSPRKFMGLPDGGIAFCEKSIEVTEIDISYDRCSHLLKRIDLGASCGYEDFRENSKKLHGLPIMQMSKLTKAMMHSIDYNNVINRRKANFAYLHNFLKETNGFTSIIDALESDSVPLVYPYLTKDSSLKKYLIENKIFVATYWPNVLEWCKPEDLEYQYAQNVIAIPIDQRYDNDDMDRIINTIIQWK